MIRVHLEKPLHTAAGMIALEVDFEVAKGELVTLFGKSGSGKTTILRMIAGLTEPQEGYIEVDGEVWFDSHRKINWPVQRRRIGFVFQEYTLFPHMTVEENLRFALYSPGDAYMIEELLATMHLKELRNRKPDDLSGGQKQRVALIRALLRRPRIFLWDEPLSALDLDLRVRLQDEMIELHRRFAVPTVFVSHDLGEICKLSNRILLLEDGRIKKAGDAQHIFGNQLVSGKFKFPGEILDIIQDEFIYIVSIQVGNTLTKVVATENEITGLNIGDKVLVAAKAFNPVILRFSHLK
jgi:molybdate transport system ATP-binding protein